MEILSYPARVTELGRLKIRRALPVRDRRMVGPWCFLDRYGPLTFADGKPMDVAPHPHVGLQTVSWLLDGEIIHNDSLGCEGLIHPRELNLMTAGAGIAHSEETPGSNSGRLNGVQLWVALPESRRNGAAAFETHREMPAVEFGGGVATLILGEMAGLRSPGSAYSPMVGADLAVHAGSTLTLPLEADHEHALLVLDGDVSLEGQELAADILYYLGSARDEMALSSKAGARVLLIGGVPFAEPVLMWWNFVGRTREEIEAAREDWVAGRRFPAVPGYKGERLRAPEILGKIRE